jgi:hypothetical protein
MFKVHSCRQWCRRALAWLKRGKEEGALVMEELDRCGHASANARALEAATDTPNMRANWKRLSSKKV